MKVIRERWLTVDDVMHQFRVERRTVLRWVREGKVIVERGYGTLLVQEDSVMLARGENMRRQASTRFRA